MTQWQFSKKMESSKIFLCPFQSYDFTNEINIQCKITDKCYGTCRLYLNICSASESLPPVPATQQLPPVCNASIFRVNLFKLQPSPERTMFILLVSDDAIILLFRNISGSKDSSGVSRTEAGDSLLSFGAMLRERPWSTTPQPPVGTAELAAHPSCSYKESHQFLIPSGFKRACFASN